MSIVVDASMALAWIFERTKPEEAECADRAIQAIAETGTVVPSLWHIEITNALLVGERRKVATEAQVIDYLARLDRLPISISDTSPEMRRDQVMALAREHGLTAYDATYLDLALRTGSVLATFDNKLANAMRNAGGIVFE
ncbi:type II toxin-antitoxin system VapC family toxin [Glaciimonas sp. GG7]